MPENRAIIAWSLRLASCFVLAAALGARWCDAAIVRTLDGKTYDGDVKVESDGAISVGQHGKPPVRIDLDMVLQAILRDETVSIARTPGAKDALPSGWQANDVGQCTPGSSATFNGSSFAIKGTGRDIGETIDAMHFCWRKLNGDGQIIARVSSFYSERNGAKAGVMFRAHLGPGAPHVMALLQNPKGSGFLRRYSDNAASSSVVGNANSKAPSWLRIVRSGNSYSAYQSDDGVNWDLLGTEKVNLGQEPHVGLAVCGRSGSTASTAVFDRVLVTNGPVKRETTELAVPPLNSGLVMRNGTIIAGQIRSVDGSVVKLVRPRENEMTISASDVARLAFRPVPPELASKVAAGRSGVLLNNGDFFEGEIRGVQDGWQVKVSSVLFGLKTFNGHADCIVIAFRNTGASTAPYEVIAADGSVLKAKSLSYDEKKDTLTVEDEEVGKIRLSLSEVFEVRAGPGRFRSLVELKPVKIDLGNRWLGQGFAMDGAIGGVPLNLAGQTADRGLGLAAGAAISYQLDGGYKSFICRAGVPSRLLPTTAVKFVVLGDDKELFRSPERTSLDEPVSISVNIGGVKVLTLRVDSVSAVDVGASGAWVSPAVLK